MKQIKSKERVKEFAEVFTNDREIYAMLDLVKDESYRIESKFLEPACGNGNFLVRILERKLETVKSISKNKEELLLNTLKSLSNIYAIDIQADNVEESKQRMRKIVDDFVGIQESLSFNVCVDYILKKNVIVGDFLNGQDLLAYYDFNVYLKDNNFNLEYTITKHKEMLV